MYGNQPITGEVECLGEEEHFEDLLVREVRERVVVTFLDWIIIGKLVAEPEQSGYDIIKFVLKRYHFLLSSGTVYSRLVSMERRGIIEYTGSHRKRLYKLTERGRLVFVVGSKSLKLRLFLKEFVRMQFVEDQMKVTPIIA
jgi:DNA-binding PadR family transcriptional regulator